MFLPRLNPIEPPWYGPVCPVVWEGWHREVSPYPDLRRTGATQRQRHTLSLAADPNADLWVAWFPCV